MDLATRSTIPQPDLSLSLRHTLPTMYDLPSEFPEEPGLPDVGDSPSKDVFHDLQPQLLSRTLQLKDYSQDNYFTGTDLNLYYDIDHSLWHKRPDWFLAVGVPRLYEGHDLRRSYVIWQEGVSPQVVVEFLSPGTEAEDLGRFYDPAAAISLKHPPSKDPSAESPPDKLTVYETYLQVPHYITYSRYTQQLRYFQPVDGQYQEVPVQPSPPQIWLADLGVGLGIWKGTFAGVPSQWLRWCDADGRWLLTDTEQERRAKEQEREAKEQEQQRAERLAAKLRELGIDPEGI